MEKLANSLGLERIILLLDTLNIFAHAQSLKQLSSISFKQDSNESEDERINAIYEYSLANYKRKIELNEIAEVANISTNSFCRYLN